MQSVIRNLVKFSLYFFGIILIILTFAYLTFKMLSFSRTVEVPDLLGKNVMEATELLNGKGLNLKIEGEDYDSIVPAGQVLKQDIPPGSRVKEHRRVKVILSKGPRVKSVPLVVGETVSRAESIFLQNGLRVGRTITVHSNTVEKNRVIAQKPNPDEQITEKITLIVSAGPYELFYYCPDFRDMKQADALQLSKELGLNLKFIGKGDVVESQKPKPGSLVKTTDMIELRTEGG